MTRRQGKTRWLDRRIAWPGPYLALCLSEREYLDALATLKLGPSGDEWCAHDGGRTHYCTNASRDSVCLVCIDPRPGRTGLEVAGLLVHEAVHVWQEYCRQIGELRPGVEQEAYAIQAIAQELMQEYRRRMR